MKFSFQEVDIKTILTDDELSLFQAGPKKVINPFNMYNMKSSFDVDLKPAAQTNSNSDAAETNNQDSVNDETLLKKNDDNQTIPFAQSNRNNFFDSLKRKRTMENDEIMKKNKNNTNKPADNESMSTNNIPEKIKNTPLRMKRETVEFVNKRMLLEIENVERNEKIAEPLNNVSITMENDIIDHQAVKTTDSKDARKIETTDETVINPFTQESSNGFKNKILKMKLEEPKQ